MPVKLVYCAALIISILASLGCEQNTASPVSGAGPWRLVNYWAVWCEPCREEIPVFNRLDQEHDLAVYGVNFDRLQGEALTTAINELGITFEVLTSDPAALLGTPRPQVLPTTLVINPQGVVIATLIGPQTEASLRHTMRQHEYPSIHRGTAQ